MGNLSKDDVLHVAKLSKLTLTPKEITKFQVQLSKVVDYIGNLSEVDTSNCQPTSQTTGLENVFRPDEVKTSNLTHDDYFVIDKILNKEE